MVQGELFREEPVLPPQKANPVSVLARYEVTLTLDKLLLLSLAVVVVFVLTYSFGVERGKRAMEKRLESLFSTAGQTIGSVKTIPTALDPQEEVVLNVSTEGKNGFVSATQVEKRVNEAANEKEISSSVHPTTSLPAVSVAQGKYTIQLITYVSEGLAASEINRLKVKGHQGFVIPSGRYFQVCADYFDNKVEARYILRKLQSDDRYPGAFIRPVVR